MIIAGQTSECVIDKHLQPNSANALLLCANK